MGGSPNPAPKLGGHELRGPVFPSRGRLGRVGVGRSRSLDDHRKGETLRERKKTPGVFGRISVPSEYPVETPGRRLVGVGYPTSPTRRIQGSLDFTVLGSLVPRPRLTGNGLGLGEGLERPCHVGEREGR